MHTLLEVKGLLIYSVPNADSYLVYCTNVALGMPPQHVTWWIGSTLTQVALRCGTDIGIERERLADLHVNDYALVLAREGLLRRLGVKKHERSSIRSLNLKVLNKLAAHFSRPLAEALQKTRIYALSVTRLRWCCTNPSPDEAFPRLF